MTSSDQQNADEMVELIRQGVLFGEGTVLEGAKGIGQMAEILRDKAHPGFVTTMVSESAGSRDFHGIEGFKEALGDWISPYESFRLEIEDAIVGDDKLVFLARQVATTKHDGVEVETESATVWWVEEGGISQVAFYLDRQMALKAAGLDPDRPSSD